jgi:C4-dicarboxylate transporter
MSFDNWITIIGVSVAAVTAILASILAILFQRYLARRDAKMEQRNEQVTPQTRWKDKALRVLFFAMPTISLVIELFSRAPINRLSIFLISMSVASILLLVFIQSLTPILKGILQIQRNLADLHFHHFEITKSIYSNHGDNTTSNPSAPESTTKPDDEKNA